VAVDVGTTLAEMPPISAGAQVGRYVVERALGDGSRAVYQARDGGLDRSVVLELLPARGETTTRLLGEARDLARLAHPNVVTVLEVGEHDGAVFIAFEDVTGEPVARWLESGTRRADEIVQVFRDAAHGMAAAHDAGVVHGDLGADSIFVDAARGVRVAFGPVSALRAGAAHARVEGRIERRRALAPEVARGEPPTPASDQWSLAAVLRDALERSTTRLPARVTRAIGRGMAAEPDRRWPSMAALARALEPPQRRTAVVVAAALGLGAISAGAVMMWLQAAGDEDRCAWVGDALDGVWDQPERVRLRRTFDAAGSAAAASASSTVRALDRYARSWTEARASLCRASRGAEDRRAALAGVCLDQRRAMLGAMAAEITDASPDRLRNAVDAAASLPPVEACEHSQHLIVQGSVASPAAIGRAAGLTAELARLDARFALGDYSVVPRARAIAAEAARLGAHSLASSAWLTVGLADRETAQPTAELEPLYESLWEAEAAGDLVAILIGWIRLVEASASAALPRAEVETMLRRAEATLARISRVDAAVADRYRVDFLTARAEFLDEHGDAAQAEAVQRQAIELMTRGARGEPTMELAAAEHALGQILIGAARYDEALEVSSRALSRTRQLVGDDHPDTMVRHFQLGWAYFFRGREDAAMGQVAACRKIARRIGAKIYLGKLAILESQIEQQRGRPQAARDALEGAIADGSASALSDFQVRYYLGEIQIALKDFDAAEGEFRKALAAIMAADPENEDVAYARSGIGMAMVQDGRAKEALPFLEAAVKQMERREHSQRPLAQMRQHLAEALWVTGDRRRAREIAVQVRTFLATLPPDLGGKELGEIERWLASHQIGKSATPPRKGRKAARRRRGS
jgi:tetratricopeptide (TPR) repeat protein